MVITDAHTIEAALPPWTLKATIYTFVMYVSSQDARQFSKDKRFLYSPLEAKSGYSEGKLLGGLGLVQVIRYSESPIGPYDELLMTPGHFEYEREVTAKDGSKKLEKKKNMRVSRIYVSTKESCLNGRTNWNIPKHLARFQFDKLSDSAISIAVFPHDTDNPLHESIPSTVPFFSATYKPIRYLPKFSASTGMAKYIGMDFNIVQPPLPKADIDESWLPGTEQWCKVLPLEYSSNTSLGWWDLKQKRCMPTEDDRLLAGSESGEPSHVEEDNENVSEWWPGIGRWRIGVKMEDATIEFPEGHHWNGPEP